MSLIASSRTEWARRRAGEPIRSSVELARLRAGGPVRSSAGALACGEGSVRCSVSWPAAQLAARASLATLGQVRRVRSRGALARAATSPVLLAAANSRPCPPTRSLASSADLYSTLARTDVASGTEGRALTGRIGAGEQRSGAGGSPARQRRTGEKALCSGLFRDTAESSQPPPRSEQRSEPSPQARAAALKPRQGAALGPLHRHRGRRSHASRVPRGALGY